MRPSCHLHVPGGNTYAVSMTQLGSLQSIVEGLEAVAYPLFLRIGGRPLAEMQPVTARALLAEVERFTPALDGLSIPGIHFLTDDGTVLGGVYAGRNGGEVAPGLFTSSGGIRVVLAQFPPPVGFRWRPGLPNGHYECYFAKIQLGPEGQATGIRTAAMGGSGVPVDLPGLIPPPATRWDVASVAGKPNVSALVPVETPALEVYRDVVHGFVSACTDSLRLMAPLMIRRS